MELILYINMDDKAFATFKDEVFKAIKLSGKSSFSEGVDANLNSTTPQEWLDNCGGYLWWLSLNSIDIALNGFAYSDGDLNLCGYQYPLSEGFTHCGGDLDLYGYNYQLPNTFTHCGGDLGLSYYKHSLPEGYTHSGRSLFLNQYNHPLPSSFTNCGGYLSDKYYNPHYQLDLELT